MPPSKPSVKPEHNALSLSCEGAVPKLLREMADRIDAGHATAEQITTVVTRDVLRLEVTLSLR
jgi:wyosine [tRNA(Phe)-imidazoG37] synthetase (radical SAM superfamily)